MEFANQLKKLRNKKGLSQEDIANEVHVTRQSVSKWESGDSTPDLATTVKLAELFDVSLDYLVLNINSEKSNDISNKKLLKKIEELNAKNNYHNGYSFAKFFRDNWFPILIVIACIYAGFHGGIRFWWHKFF